MIIEVYAFLWKQTHSVSQLGSRNIELESQTGTHLKIVMISDDHQSVGFLAEYILLVSKFRSRNIELGSQKGTHSKIIMISDDHQSERSP